MRGVHRSHLTRPKKDLREAELEAALVDADGLQQKLTGEFDVVLVHLLPQQKAVPATPLDTFSERERERDLVQNAE